VHAAAGSASRLALMLLSGFAGLGYQIVWTRQGALWLGHDLPAVLAVVGAFFGGLALGAWLAGPRVERSAHPQRWYAACELLIGGWALLLLVMGEPTAALLAGLTASANGAALHGTLAFAGTFVLLLPATTAMGATLPALAAVERRRGTTSGLYAANTLGAVVGVLATAFWLLPHFGLARTAVLCAAVNLACAVLAWRLAGESALPQAHSPAAPAGPGPAADRGPLLRLGCTGLLGIGFEVVAVRALSQVAENTVYTFATILAVYLVGTALGAAWHARRQAAGAAGSVGQQPLLLALALACGAGAAALAYAPDLERWARHAASALGLAGFGSALLAEAAVAVVALMAPTFAMGAVFARLCEDAREAGHPLGRALAWNTSAAALAPLLFGVLLIPALGTGATLAVVIAGYALLAAPGIGLALHPHAWGRWTAGIALLAAGAAALPGLRLVDVPAGGRLLSHRYGASADVAVVEDADGVRWLHIDNREPEGSSGTAVADGRQAVLPLLLHGAPSTALFLGVGSGVTSATAARWPALRVDAVELLPEVLAATVYFDIASAPSAANRIVADARRFVRQAGAPYDVIVADNFHPARSGSGSLYTVEHFRAVRDRLAAAGVFCQWLPLHQMDEDTLRSVVRSFTEVFPQARALLATLSLPTPVLGLIGGHGGRQWDPAQLEAALALASRPGGPGTPGLATPLEVLGQFVAGPRALAAFAGGAPLNTDDHPVVAYRAPRAAHDGTSPGERLLTLLARTAVSPEDVLPPQTDPGLAVRLQRYWSARDRFLHAGHGVQPTSDAIAMLARVREPLLAVLRESPEFRPAAEPLQRLRVAVAEHRPLLALQLQRELEAIGAPGPPR
jgi:spermidine synthase